MSEENERADKSADSVAVEQGQATDRVDIIGPTREAGPNKGLHLQLWNSAVVKKKGAGDELWRGKKKMND